MRNEYIYLLNLKLSGVKNIKGEIELKFYKKTITKDFNPDKYRVKAIYGENGSGKTAIITAVKILRNIIIESGYLNDPSNQQKLNEIINKSTNKMHLECEYIFKAKNVNEVLRYSFTLAKNENNLFVIEDERLSQRNGNYQSEFSDVYSCKNGKLCYIDGIDLEKKSEIVEATMNLLEKESLISCLISKNNYELVLDNSYVFALHVIITSFFALFLNVSLDERDQHDLYFSANTLKRIAEEQKIISSDEGAILNLIHSKLDVSGKNVSRDKYEDYEKNVRKLERFLKIFKQDLEGIEIIRKEIKDGYNCSLNFLYSGYAVNQEFESAGIKRLINLFEYLSNPYSITFIDEMDVNINDVYLCKLIEYYMYYGEGQLCFTTHNTSPMSILKNNKNSIDFLASDNIIVSWKKNGNFSPENLYKAGMIDYLPFNIEPSDFLGILGE